MDILKLCRFVGSVTNQSKVLLSYSSKNPKVCKCLTAIGQVKIYLFINWPTYPPKRSITLTIADRGVKVNLSPCSKTYH